MFWNFLSNVFRIEKKRETPAASDASAPAPAATVRTGAEPLFVYTGGNDMAIAAVYRCVKLMSESVATLPVRFLRLRGGVMADAGDRHMDYLLNVQPDPQLSAFDFWRQVVVELLLDGNAYIVPVYSSATMRCERLALCHRGTVSHDLTSGLYTVSDLEGGVSGVYRSSDIIHIKGMTLRDPRRGVSVLTFARMTMDIALTADGETRQRFANGGTVKGLVSNDRSVRGFGEYQDKQLEATARDLNYRYNVAGENIVASPGQVGFTQISMSSVDMQFLESRKFTVLEICRFFSVPPSFVYADTGSNYKSVEQADVDFLTHTLSPLLRNIETELRRKLVAPSIAHKYRFSFDRRELFGCNPGGMAEYSARLLQVGATVNEVRQGLGLGPVEGGDTPLVSANLRGVGETQAAAEEPEMTKNPGDPAQNDSNSDDSNSDNNTDEND